MRAHSHLLAALLIATSAAVAQCQFSSVPVVTYGQGCSAVFGNNPTLAFQLDTAACSLGVGVQAFQGCCNTYRLGVLLALGDQAAAIPVPQLGPNCDLLTSSTVTLWLPGPQGTTFWLALPPGLSSVTLFAQGGALYFTTIGLSYDFALTAGTQFSLQ